MIILSKTIQLYLSICPSVCVSIRPWRMVSCDNFSLPYTSLFLWINIIYHKTQIKFDFHYGGLYGSEVTGMTLKMWKATKFWFSDFYVTKSLWYLQAFLHIFLLLAYVLLIIKYMSTSVLILWLLLFGVMSLWNKKIDGYWTKSLVCINMYFFYFSINIIDDKIQGQFRFSLTWQIPFQELCSF